MKTTISKIPEITFLFWAMKVCATTLGETAGDLLSMTMDVGYALSSLILICFFLLSLIVQLKAKKYHPSLYWIVILTTSTAGTTISDYMDRTLGFGYLTGSLILVAMLVGLLSFWRITVGSISVTEIKSLRVELLYWTAILISNTLGTALGDFLADDSGLGFAGGALLISSLIAVVVILNYTSALSKVILFWLAFVLTRPLGATVGDLLTKDISHGGLNLGTIGSSALLAAVLFALVAFTSHQGKRSLLTEAHSQK